MTRHILWVVLALAFALPGGLARAEPLPDDRVIFFYKAYYVEREEGRAAEALVLYDEFLIRAPDHELAPKAALMAKALIMRTDPSQLDRFIRRHGYLLPKAPVASDPAPREAAPAEEAPPEPTADELLLRTFEEAAAAGIRPPEVASAGRSLEGLTGLFRQGEFMKGARLATRMNRILAIWNVAEMIQRRQVELAQMRKRRAVDAGLGTGLEEPVYDSDMRQLELAIADSRTQAGLHAQIAAAYPGAFREPGRYGFLALVSGTADPTDQRFRKWLGSIRMWLEQQALRSISTPESVEEAMRAGKAFAGIEAYVAAGQIDDAYEATQRMWALLTSE